MKKKIALATLAMMPLSVNNVYTSGQMGVVTATSLNVRSGPGTNNNVLFTVKKNETVEIKDSANGWYKIKNSLGKEGWASSTYISKYGNTSNSETITTTQKQTTTSVNFRNGAGTSYRIIATLSKGTKVEVISESSGWTKVKYDGRLGYIASNYLEDIKINSNTSVTKEVSTDSLNVRSGPNTSYSVLGKLKKGTKVSVISENNGWSKINYNGKEAYVSSRYLSSISQNNNDTSKPESIKETKEVNTDSLNVRSGPGTNYSKLGKLSKGSKVGVISESNGWSKINYNGKEAYVSSKYLNSISQNNNNDTSKPESVKETKEVNTNSLNVRSGPGTNYSKLGSLSKGTKVEVISESNGWSKINYNGKEAYVSSQYLSKVTINKPSTPEIAPPVVGGDSTQIVNGATINHKGLNYSLNDHVNAQLERVSVGGNVIDSSKPRSSEILTTFKIREAQTRGFVKADREDLEYFLNPENFKNSKKGMLQFLRIDNYKGGITVNELNSFLNSNGGTSGVFYNKGQSFIDAAKKYDIDLVYLVAHSMWETNYGKSTLAKGQTITSYKGKPLSSPVKVYNFFGIGAIDGSANLSGAEAAYANGWTSVESTIDGSAKWIASNYIKSSKYKQNTIYKMKFNYEYTWHQYATDVNWANGISGIMNKIIHMYDSGNNLVFEVPNYKQ